MNIKKGGIIEDLNFGPYEILMMEDNYSIYTIFFDLPVEFINSLRKDEFFFFCESKSFRIN